MLLWNALAFSMIQWMLAIWSLVPLPFLKPAWTSGSSLFTYCWSLTWRNPNPNTLVWDECHCVVVWALFGTAFLWDWNENWRFPVLWPLLSFPDLLAYLVGEMEKGKEIYTFVLISTPYGGSLVAQSCPTLCDSCDQLFYSRSTTHTGYVIWLSRTAKKKTQVL